MFGENYESWLGLVDNIVIEPHDDAGSGSASEAFEHALSGHRFVSHYGNVTFARATP